MIQRVDARVMLRSIPAVSPSGGWSTAVGTIAAPSRHLGGIAFSSSGAGLMVSADGAGFNKGRLSQFTVTRSGANYVLTNPQFTHSFSTRTRRPFGIARNPTTDQTLVVYLDVGVPRPMAVISKTGLSALTAFLAPTFPILDVRRGTDIAFDSINAMFVTGLSM
jgi:hypothetical protein